MEILKMYFPSLCRNSTYQCGAANYPVSWEQYRAGNGNMQNFGRTCRDGTAFLQEQYSYKNEAMGMENPKMYCSSP